MKKSILSILSILSIVSVLSVSSVAIAADANSLYGIHWWGYSGGAVDNNPAVMLDSVTNGGWDVETVITHSDPWWQPTYFVPLYAELSNNKNVSIITRIDYNWGETVPSPSNPDYAAWSNSVISAVNSLKDYCHIWIIGNEPNINGEGNNWPDNHITPAGYATIYETVRDAIHNSAQPSPLGEHIVLVAGVSPGGVIGGVRWMAGNTWLSETIDNIPTNKIDGFSIHAYGGTIANFHGTYVSQLDVINSKNLWGKPAYITEFNKAVDPMNSSGEAGSAQFVRDAFADLHAWNIVTGHHNIVSASWFIYDSNQQAGGVWNKYAIEYWRDHGNPLGNANNLFTAFEQTVDLRYPAGIVGTLGGIPTSTVAGINEFEFKTLTSQLTYQPVSSDLLQHPATTNFITSGGFYSPALGNIDTLFNASASNNGYGPGAAGTFHNAGAVFEDYNRTIMQSDFTIPVQIDEVRIFGGHGDARTFINCDIAVSHDGSTFMDIGYARGGNYGDIRSSYGTTVSNVLARRYSTNGFPIATGVKSLQFTIQNVGGASDTFLAPDGAYIGSVYYEIDVIGVVPEPVLFIIALIPPFLKRVRGI